MLLKDKTAVIHGAGGAVGGAVALAFAREGARLFLAGRTIVTVDGTARKIGGPSDRVETAEVDALDEQAVERHAALVAERASSVHRASGWSVSGLTGSSIRWVSIRIFHR